MGLWPPSLFHQSSLVFIIIVFEIRVNLLCSIMQILWLSCCLDAMVGDVNLFLTETDCAEESAGPTTSAEVEVMIAGE